MADEKLRLCEKTYNFLIGYLCEHVFKSSAGELETVKKYFKPCFKEENNQQYIDN